MAKICRNCGTRLNDDEVFCPECGAELYPPVRQDDNFIPEGMINEGQKVTKNISFCLDGKYRWVYEMSLFRNPTIFFLVWKIFFFITLGIFGFIIIVDLINENLDSEMLTETLRFFVYFTIGMTVVVGISYLIYAAIMGGKYVVLFEMDEKGINHIQHPKQVKKAEVISDITILAGLASGRLSTVAAGMNTRTEMQSDFETVRKVRSYPRRNLIKVDGLIEHNQVYAEKEDYEFVRNFIISRCNNAKVRK